jgi:hypothetical protein
MPHHSRPSWTRRPRLVPLVEPLEHRTPLTAAASSLAVPKVTIQVPSSYISQQSGALDVTLVRKPPAGQHRPLGPLTVNFSAAPGSLPAGLATPESTPGAQFNPIDGPVTFPAGVTAEMVVVPIHSGAPNPALVPIALAVTSASQPVASSSSTVYLAATTDALPPSIIAVQRVRGGIAITFSKPMDRASVQDIHNYKVKYSPSQHFNPLYLTSVGLVQALAATSQRIPLRRAIYDAATNTVILVPKQQLQSDGSYQISSPASLRAKLSRPNKAHPLTDLEGNALQEGGSTPGAFSVSISKGHPYTAAGPVLADGS